MQMAMSQSSMASAAPESRGQEYLECLHALSGELEIAMGSIVDRKLASLEESVSRQVVICSQLSFLVSRPNQLFNTALDSPNQDEDDELVRRISAATATLINLNKRYSALLKLSGSTMELLAGLIRSYTGNTNLAAMLAANYRTWSCQI
jgi:hypothetical protein